MTFQGKVVKSLTFEGKPVEIKGFKCLLCTKIVTDETGIQCRECEEWFCAYHWSGDCEDPYEVKGE